MGLSGQLWNNLKTSSLTKINIKMFNFCYKKFIFCKKREKDRNEYIILYNIIFTNI